MVNLTMQANKRAY